MKHKKKLHGFTLIELIVVMALFGMIIAVALGLLTPINHLNKYATANADAQAVEDDLRRFLESRLQYADRFAVYTNVNITNEQEAVDAFRHKYYLDDSNRTEPCSTYTGDTVNVIHIDNPDTISNGMNVATDSRIGTVTLRQYINGVYNNNPRQWALRSDYYRDYAFNIDIGSLSQVDEDSDGILDAYKVVPLNETEKDSATNTYVSPNNFTFTVSMFKKDRIAGNLAQKTLSDTGIDKAVSFKLKNIVNNANAIKNETILFNDGSTKSARRFHWYDSLPNAENISNAGQHDDDSAVGVNVVTTSSGNDIYLVFSTSLDIEALLS